MRKERTSRLGAIVVYPNEERGSVPAIAEQEAKKALHTSEEIDIAEIMFSAAQDVYVALFKLPPKRRSNGQ